MAVGTAAVPSVSDLSLLWGPGEGWWVWGDVFLVTSPRQLRCH